MEYKNIFCLSVQISRTSVLWTTQKNYIAWCIYSLVWSCRKRCWSWFLSSPGCVFTLLPKIPLEDKIKVNQYIGTKCPMYACRNTTKSTRTKDKKDNLYAALGSTTLNWADDCKERKGRGNKREYMFQPRHTDGCWLPSSASVTDNHLRREVTVGREMRNNG